MTAYRKFACRCPDAAEDKRLYEKRRREGRLKPGFVDATGTARRLQALAVAGYGCDTIGDLLGLDHTRVAQLRARQYPTIHAKRAATVTAVFEQLQMTVAADTESAKYVRRHASRQGWAPAAAWDDIDDPAAVPQHDAEDDDPKVIDEVELGRLLLGRLPADRSKRRARLNRAAVDILTRRGLTAEEIAGRLKIEERSVVRIRSKLDANSNKFDALYQCSDSREVGRRASSELVDKPVEPTLSQVVPSDAAAQALTRTGAPVQDHYSVSARRYDRGHVETTPSATTPIEKASAA